MAVLTRSRICIETADGYQIQCIAAGWRGGDPAAEVSL